MAKTRGGPRRPMTTASTRSTVDISPIRKPVSQRTSPQRLSAKTPVESIRDFKQMNGQTLYLVHRTDQKEQEDTWETEDTIESLNIVTAFHDRVRTSTGYTTNGDNNTNTNGTTLIALETTATTAAETTPPKRPSRISKTRAMLRLLEQPTSTTASTTIDSDDSMDSELRNSRKRKRSAAPTKKKTTTGTVLTARGKALLRLQLDLIEQRKNERARWLETHQWEDHDHYSLDSLNCCLRCSIKAYRQAIINNDLAELKKILEDSKTYPSWTMEERLLIEDNVVKLATSLGYGTMVDLLKDNKLAKRINLSTSLTTYGSNTGSVSRYTFGRAVKQVNESRGNRQGNSAFYHTAHSEDFNVDHKFHHEYMDECIALLHTPLIENPSVLKCLLHLNTNPYFLYYVVASGTHTAAVKLLKEKKDSSGFNMLHHAVLLSRDLPSYRKNQILKKAYYSANLSPLMCAAINPSATHLTSLFEQLDPAERVEVDEFGRTIAHYAATSTTPNCLEYLISQSYNFSQADKYRLTPLIQAARFGRHQNIRPLLKYLSNDTFPCTDFADQTLLRNRRRPIHYAAAFGHGEVCKELIDCGATVDAVESSQKMTPLMLASHRGHLDCVKTLVEYGRAGLHLVDKFARSPLHLACMSGHYDVAKYLLIQGLDADAHDSSNNTPAHYVCAFGHIEVLKLLIEFGAADPSSNNVWRSTPCSVADLKGHIAIVQYLLTLPGGRVNVDFKDQDGFTMLHHAVKEKVTNVSEIEQNLRRIQVLLGKNANVNVATIDKNTVLHTLMTANYYNKHLLEYQQPSGVYQQPSGVVIDEQVCIEYQQKVARLIIEAGADVNAVNAAKNTPLAVAMANQNYPMVALLIENGAQYWGDVDDSGNTFYHGLLYGSAQLDNVRLEEMSTTITWEKRNTIQSRYVESISSIWDAIQANPIPEDQTHENKIDHFNNQGYNALLYGIFEAIKMQRDYITEEKKIVKSGSSSRYHNRFDTTNVDTTTRRPMRFVFKFDHFFYYAKKLLDLFKPNVNAVVKLPKNYLKKNPNAKPKDYPRETGCSVLQLAAHTQHVPLLDFLLSYGANPDQQAQNSKTMCGVPPTVLCYFQRHDNDSLYLPGNTTLDQERIHKLYDIAMPSFETDRYDSLDTFIKYGGNPCLPDGNGTSALMKAAMALDGKAVQIMCRSLTAHQTGGIDYCDESNSTALMIAFSAYTTKYNTANDSDRADITAITHLISMGANVNATYKNGDTVLMKILRLGFFELVEALLQLTPTPLDHMAKNTNQETPLIVACKTGGPAMLKIYLARLGSDFSANKSIDIKDCVNAMDHENNTPLALAASKGDLTTVRTLLEYQANPNNATSDKSPLFEAIKSKQLDVVDALLCAGANTDAQDSDTSSSALHHAVRSEKIAMVRLLLKHNASPSLTDKMRQTPLHWAIQLSKNQTNRSMRIERLLLQSGADINAKDIFDRTPLHIVFTGLHIVPWMQTTNLTYKKVKALMEERKLAKKEEQSVKEYVEKFGRVNGDLDAWLEQHKRLAIEQEKLLKNRENHDSEDDEKIKLTDNNRITLAKYLDYGFEQDLSIAPFDPVDMLKDLMDTPGIELDQMDSFGRTPLHYAVIVDALSCVNMMLDSNKVDVNTQDYDTNGGVQLALRYGHSNMAVMIHNRGGSDSDIVFPDGHKDSAISYSLSQSYMNVSYLFMSNTETVLNSLFDSLAKGKFHFAHTLLRNASDSVLMGTIPQTNQNLWHVISNFAPFDVDMWNDYLPDFLERLETLDLKFTLDKNNCTPLHYAALHGQETLMKHLLTLDPHPQCHYDATNMQSQVWAAVLSNNLNCVKMLLDAGLPLTTGSYHTKPSILLQAVYNGNRAMVELLLQHGVELDGDSDYGRRNPVMAACVKEQVDILEVLIKAGASVDKPSTISRRKQGKVYYTMTSPIFVGSVHKSNEILKILLKASANTNVIGPQDKNVEQGRSCLMFNICNNRVDNVKLLLEHGANLDMKDDHSNRSAFYRVFFEKEALSCKEEIYQMLFNHSPGPNINIVDEESGMVPLEAAIRNHDIALVDRLLILGANPNIVSCKKKSDACDLYNDIVNAIFHCVLNDDSDILKSVCETTLHTIDWTAVDYKGRTVLSRIIDINENFGFKNLTTLDYLVKQMGTTLFKKVVEIPDNEGNRPTQIAMNQNRKGHLDALVKYGARPASLHTATTRDDNGVPEDRMDIEQMEISLRTVETDAEAERAVLQELAELRKKKKPMQPTTDDNKAAIDPYSKLEKIGTMVFDQGEPYDIMIMKVEVGSCLYSSNMFYKMSVIYNKLLDLYVLWTRWGAFGDIEGMHQKTPYLTQDEAVAEFKSIFKSKTGNHWDDHRTNFVEKPGRYQLIKARDPTKDAILDDVDLNFTHNEMQPTQLPNNLHNTMKLFCNFETLKNAYKNIKLDIPIGQVPPDSIRQATAILGTLRAIVTKLYEYNSRGDPNQRTRRKELIHTAIQESSRYYRLLPTYNDKRGLEPILNTVSVDNENARLNDARYINFTLNVVLAAKHRAKEINPFDYSYRSLGCQLAEIEPDSRTFNVVSKYMTSTAKDSGYEIAHLFSVDRDQEKERFKPYAADPNRKLLWHGSQLGNFMGILNQGLRSKPAAAEESGSMFGNGIYFADMFCKSVNFATNVYGTKNPAYGLLLLCEVALGEECKVTPHNFYQHAQDFEEKGFASFKGLGKEGPNLSNSIYDANGVMIPMGPAVKLDAPEDSNVYDYMRTTYNEYVVRDEARVKIRYMVLVRHNDYCFLCQSLTNRNHLKPLKDHEFGPDGFSCVDVNSFEQQIFGMYLQDIEKTPKQLFDEKLPGFLKNQNSNKSLQEWSLPLDIETTSQVCGNCAKKMVSIMLTEELQQLQQNSDVITDKYPFFNLKTCRDGRECKLQHKSLAHAKLYQHWTPKKEGSDDCAMEVDGTANETDDEDQDNTDQGSYEESDQDSNEESDEDSDS